MTSSALRSNHYLKMRSILQTKPATHAQMNLHRRKLLGAAAAAFATPLVTSLAGCGSANLAQRHAFFNPRERLNAAAFAAKFTRPYSTQPFARVAMSAANEARVLVGFRPYRAAGFVVRLDQFGDKFIIHNYGHGGGGITMSWGSSTLAVRALPDIADKRATVLGAGMMGLTTAVLLQERGWQVTILTRDMPLQTTSAIAGGYFAPTSVFSRIASGITPQFLSQYAEALQISHDRFTALLGRGYGVHIRENYHLNAGPITQDDVFYLRDHAQYFPMLQTVTHGQHPFPTAYALHHLSLMISPNVLLPRLTDDIFQRGGTIVQREMLHRDELHTLSTPVIFNCTGMGAKTLFDDDALTPVRGQVLLLPPDPRVDYLTHINTRETGLLYMFPRDDSILIGGSFERENLNPHPDEAITSRIISNHTTLFAGMALAE